MTTQPCPIYPEGCHDPQRCVLGSPCAQQEESLAARLASFGLSDSIKVYSQRNTMDEDERMDQITALVAKWRATRAYDDLSESRLMGLAAIVVSGSTPREWGPGDTIPADVTTVEGRGGIEWVRDPDPGAGVWTTNSPISDEELVSLFGPVREVGTEDWEPGDWWGLASAAVLDDGHQEQVPVDVPARLAASVIPVLKEAREATRQVDQAYRNGRRMNAVLSRRAKNAAAQCDAAIEALTELTGEQVLS